MSTAPDGLVSLAWPTRGGYGYRLESSPDLADDSWQPLATFHGNGGTLSIPVARITLPGAQPPPPAPPADLRSAHFVLRTFAGLNRTLVAWNQPGQTGLSRVLLNADFSSIVSLPLFFGKFEDPANATDYLLSFLLLGGEFDPAYDGLTVAALNPEEAERLAWFTDRLAEVKAAMETAQANGQATNNAPATGAGSGGPGAHVFFRIAELYQDSDGDGILDHHEGDATGSDPWDSDSDNDGFSDGEEFVAGSDPNNANSTPANHTGGPSGSDLPPDEDQDEDYIPNALDADPLDIHVDWERRPFPNFIVLPIPNTGGLVPAAVNNKGQVVLNAEEPSPGGPSIARHWKPGMESPVALKLGNEPESPLTLAPRLFAGYDAVGKPVAEATTLTLTDIIARDINDQGVIVGEGRFVGASPGTTGTGGSNPALGPSVTIALQWDNAGAAPSTVHPGFADMTRPGHNWGDLLLDSAATKLNESGMVAGHAEYRIGAPGQAPPFLASAPVPNYWSPFAIGGEGAALYDPAEIPTPAPVITGIHRVNDEFTGGTGDSSAAYWDVWTETPAHVFPEAGAASVGVATVPNGREAIAGTNRLMLFSEDDRWEPALRTYAQGFGLTENGAVWFTGDGEPALWNPLEKSALNGITGSLEYAITAVADVTNTGVVAAVSDIGNLVLLPVEVVEGQPGTDDESPGTWLMTATNPTPRIETELIEAEIVGSALRVRLRGTVHDGLSAYARVPTDRVREVGFELYGKSLGTIELTGDAGEEATFTEELTIPDVRSGNYLLRARTEPNAAGNVGWDDVVIGVTRDWATPDGLPEADTFRIAFGNPPDASTLDTATIYFGARDPLPSDGTATESNPATSVFVGSATYGTGHVPCTLALRGPTTFSPSISDAVEIRISLTLPTGTAVLAATMTETAPGSLVFFLPEGTPSALTSGLMVALTAELEGSAGESEARPFTVRMPSSPEFPDGTVMRVGGTDYPVKEFSINGRTALYPYAAGDPAHPKLFLPCVSPLPDYLVTPGYPNGTGTRTLNFELVPGGDPAQTLDLVSLQVQPGSPPANPYVSPFSAGTGSASAHGAGNGAAARWKKPGDKVTMDDLLDTFKFLYGDQGQRLLGYFEDADGVVELGDVSGDLDIDFFTPDIYIHLQIEDDDKEVAGSLYHPGIAAHLLWQGLNECLVYGDVQAQMPAEEWQLFQQGREQFGQFACGVGVAAGQLYLAGISIALEPVDWVLTLNELSEGNYTALAGALPFIPAGIFSGGRGLLLRGPGGEVLDRIGSADQLAELQDLYRISDANERLRVMGVIVEREQFNDTIRSILAAGNGPIAPYRKDSQRKLLEKRMKEIRPVPNWGKRTIVCTDGKTRGYRIIRAHHDLPWEHHDFFTEHGLDPNDPAFGRWVGDYDHYLWHDDVDLKFNDFWEDFIDAEDELEDGVKYTKQQIIDKLAEAREEYPVTNGN